MKKLFVSKKDEVRKLLRDIASNPIMWKWDRYREAVKKYFLSEDGRKDSVAWKLFGSILPENMIRVFKGKFKMALNDLLRIEELKERFGYLKGSVKKNAGRLVVGGTIAAVGAGLAAPALGEDSVERHFDRSDNYTGMTVTQEAPKQVDPARKFLDDKAYTQLVGEGVEAYQNHAWSAAEDYFREASKRFPGKVEPNVWQVKARYDHQKHYYLVINKSSPAKAESMALEKSVMLTESFLETKPENPVLLALKNRLKLGISPETFDSARAGDYAEAAKLFGEGNGLYLEGVKSHNQGKYVLANQKLEESVRLDPNNCSAWIVYGTTAGHITQGDKGKKFSAYKTVLEKGLSFNPDSQSIKKDLERVKRFAD